jgi:hypothetical protein
VGTYFLESYSWVTVRPGLVYLALGCGIVTVVASVVAVAWYGGINAMRGRPLGTWAPELMGPIALVLIPLVFFLPNPVPTRHFFLVLAGMAILLGITLVRIPRISRVLTCCIALAIGAGDQVASEMARPTLVRINEAHSPYISVPEAYPTATHANLGWEWERHDTLLERREKWNAFGEKLLTSCDAHVMVLSDEMEQIFSRLYENGTPVKARRILIPVSAATPTVKNDGEDAVHLALVGDGNLRLPGFIGVRDGKTFIMVEKAHAWPADPVAAILANPAYNDYKIIGDPYTMSQFDKTPVPPDRQPRFGCSNVAGSK